MVAIAATLWQTGGPSWKAEQEVILMTAGGRQSGCVPMSTVSWCTRGQRHWKRGVVDIDPGLSRCLAVRIVVVDHVCEISVASVRIGNNNA